MTTKSSVKKVVRYITKAGDQFKTKRAAEIVQRYEDFYEAVSEAEIKYGGDRFKTFSFHVFLIGAGYRAADCYGSQTTIEEEAYAMLPELRSAEKEFKALVKSAEYLRAKGLREIETEPCDCY